MITPRTIANVTAICRAGVDTLSGNGRGGLGMAKSSREPARLFLTPNFPASELKLELLKHPSEARCSAGVNPQSKNNRWEDFQDQRGHVAGSRRPALGQGFTTWSFQA